MTDTDEYPWRDKATLEELYWEKNMLPAEIAEELGCHKRTITDWLNRLDIEQRSPGENMRLAWQRNSVPHLQMEAAGYMQWCTRHDYTRYTFKVHRLLAIAEFGIEAVKDNHVHHKNGIRWDNRPNNIELMTPEDHARHHYESGDTGQELMEYNLKRSLQKESGQADFSAFVTDAENGRDEQ